MNLSVYVDGLGPGGAENLLLELIPLLKRSNIVPTLYCFRGRYSKEERFASAGFNVIKLSLPRMMIHMLFDRSTRYVHLSKSLTLSLIALIIRHWFGIKTNCVWHSHTTLQFFRSISQSSPLYNGTLLFLLRYALSRRLVRIIVGTEVQRQEMFDLVGSRNAKHVTNLVTVVVNTFPASTIAALTAIRDRRKSPMADNTLRFFTLSRLYAPKQLDWAIDACATVAKQFTHIKFELKICGQGDDRERLEKYAQQFQSVQNLGVAFPGFLDRINEIAEKSEFYLFPSKIEGFPLSLAEAALTGVQCIANDCPTGPKELAEYFANITLASPPSHDIFVQTAVSTVTALIEGRTSSAYALRHWPTLEEIAPVVATFLQKV
jgi:glycosyltransferase involved in cell wall biosynthesis